MFCKEVVDGMAQKFKNKGSCATGSYALVSPDTLVFVVFDVCVLSRYEDNFDAVNNAMVLVLPTDKSSIEGYGSPDKLVADLAYLLGKQAFEGKGRGGGGR